jgi:hypothetical protein
MELILNLAWLLLVLPAYLLWRGARLSRARRKVSSLHCLLALGCVLVILFPVISATDDLHAMRPEMEESSNSKRSLRQASQDKSPLSGSRIAVQPVTPVASFGFVLTAQYGELLPVLAFSPPVPPSALFAGRAPPVYPS